MPEREATPAQLERYLAESLGFTCERDLNRGGDLCRFYRGPWCVWETASKGWIAARLEGSTWLDHFHLPTLEACLRHVKGELEPDALNP